MTELSALFDERAKTARQYAKNSSTCPHNLFILKYTLKPMVVHTQ